MKYYENKNGILVPKEKQEQIEPEQWSINITMPDFSPRKVTADELAKNRAEYDSVKKVCDVLTKINKLLTKSKLQLYQYREDEIFVPDGAVKIDGIYAPIDNETGIFELPELPELWDENTIVRPAMPFMNFGGEIHTWHICE